MKTKREQTFTTIIENGTVIDGTGRQSFVTDIAVSGDMIMAMGDLENFTAQKRIDAEGLWVTPGFVDSFYHVRLDDMLEEVGKKERIKQGITSEVCSLTGSNHLPIPMLTRRNELGKDEDIYPMSLKEFSYTMNDTGNTSNIITFITKGKVDQMARQQKKENDKLVIEEFIRESMETGAFGIFRDHLYKENGFINKEDEIEFCKILAEYDGVYASIVSGETDKVIEEIETIIEIVEKSGCKGHISHVKLSGIKNQGQSEKYLELIDGANSRGVDVSFSVSPHGTSSVALSLVLPKWFVRKEAEQEEEVKKEIATQLNCNTWDNIVLDNGYKSIVVDYDAGINKYRGKSIDAISKEIEKNHLDTILKILEDTKGQATISLHLLKKKDFEALIKSPYCMVESDPLVTEDYECTRILGKKSVTHRGYQRFLAKYVLEKEIITKEHAIRMITGYPAERFGVDDRGTIEVGKKADIVLIDPEKVMENNKNMFMKQENLEYIMINGKVVVNKGEFEEIEAGMALTKKA